VGILDADKEGFLRSETSLIQTIGRAARNVKGRVVLYADQMTNSMEKAIGETNRRRERQIKYNTEHNITPVTIKKNIKDITETIAGERAATIEMMMTIDMAGATDTKSLKALIARKREQMEHAVEVLDFETAALLRDELYKLEEKLPEPKKHRKKPFGKKDNRVFLDED
jgi:excinuclease ABC subunit B